MGLDVVETCLKRSGILPLEIFLNPFARSPRTRIQHFRNLVRMISTSSDRWSAFTLYVTNPMDAKDAELGQLSSLTDALEGLNATQLKALEIHIPGRIARTDMHISTIPGQFCHTWNVPRLHTMTASQYIPQPFSELTMLGRLDLELGNRSRSGLVGKEMLDIEALHRFLASCPMLTDLRVHMSRLVGVAPVRPLDQPFALTQIESISLGFHSCSASFIDMVLGTLAFPAASKLSLSLGLGVNEGPELPQTVRAILDGQTRFSSLERLELGIECVDSALQIKHLGGLGRVQLPLSLLESITHLTLRVENFKVLLLDDHRIQPLHYLHLKNCNTIGRGWMNSILKKLEEQDDLESLEEVRTELCEMMSSVSVCCHTIPQGDLVKHIGELLR